MRTPVLYSDKFSSDKTPRVALVGHGPSPAGRGLGPEIDAHDIVFRFHDCEYQLKTPADYGAAFTAGSLPGPWADKAIPPGPCLRPQPKWRWFVYQIDRRLRLPGNVSGLVVVDIRALQDKFLSLGARCRRGTPALSRGGATAAMIAKLWPHATLTLYGCDALALGDPAAFRYTPDRYDAPSIADIETRHDMRAEHELVFAHLGIDVRIGGV